jgi:hypothetical protein
MAIDSNAAASNFTYGPGSNKLGEVTDRLIQTANYLASSPIYQSDITNFGYLLTLPPVNPLPLAVPTGSVAVSGSGANIKLYVFTGAGTTRSGWATASIGG